MNVNCRPDVSIEYSTVGTSGNGKSSYAFSERKFSAPSGSHEFSEQVKHGTMAAEQTVYAGDVTQALFQGCSWNANMVANICIADRFITVAEDIWSA